MSYFNSNKALRGKPAARLGARESNRAKTDGQAVHRRVQRSRFLDSPKVAPFLGLFWIVGYYIVTSIQSKKELQSDPDEFPSTGKGPRQNALM